PAGASRRSPTTARTPPYPLSLHDALPISQMRMRSVVPPHDTPQLNFHSVVIRLDVPQMKIRSVVPPHDAPQLNFRSVVIRLDTPDRKSTRLNSSHVSISYAVFCLNKKK